MPLYLYVFLVFYSFILACLLRLFCFSCLFCNERERKGIDVVGKEDGRWGRPGMTWGRTVIRI